MTINTFGYEPVSMPSYVAQYDDYAYGEQVDYAATDWEDDHQINIASLWEAVRYESDEQTRGLAEMWARMELLLDTARSALEQHALALQESWSSPAGEMFLRRVGAAIYSLEQWRVAAADNKTAMNTVADAIADKQAAMSQLWSEYVEADRNARESHYDGFGASVWNWATDATTYQDVMDDYTSRAKPIMKDLAETYVDASIALNRGTIYKGPTSAKKVSEYNPYDTGGSNGTNRPNIPVLNTPTLPTLDLPPRPEGPVLAGVGTLPAPPPAPTLPPPVVAPSAPGLPGLPVPPGVLGPLQGAPARLAAPGAGSGASGAGTGARGSTMPKSRPTLPGSSARSGSPTPPGARGRPNLRGTSKRAAPGAESPGSSGTRMPPGPRGRTKGEPGSDPLQGRRGSAAGEPRPSASGATPRARSPLAGRRAAEPGTASPRRIGRGLASRILGNRGTAVPKDGGGIPPRPQLDGRRQAEGDSGRGIPRASARRRGRSAEERARGSAVAGEELWQVDAAHPDLDTPPPPQPPRPGPAIGRDA